MQRPSTRQPITKSLDVLLAVDSDLERVMAQWLGCSVLLMSLSAVRFRTPLGAGFSEKYPVSPHSILGHCFDVVTVVSLGKPLQPQMFHLIQVKINRPTL